MGTPLSSIVPKAQDLLGLGPEELGRALMKCLISLPQNDLHLTNFLNRSGYVTNGYPPEYHDEIRGAMNAAWRWLEMHGYIMVRKDSNDADWVDISPQGRRWFDQSQSAGFSSSNARGNLNSEMGKLRGLGNELVTSNPEEQLTSVIERYRQGREEAASTVAMLEGLYSGLDADRQKWLLNSLWSEVLADFQKAISQEKIQNWIYPVAIPFWVKCGDTAVMTKALLGMLKPLEPHIAGPWARHLSGPFCASL